MAREMARLRERAPRPLHKLYGLLDERPAVAERPGAVDLPERGRLEVDHVSFAYGAGPPVLRFLRP